MAPLYKIENTNQERISLLPQQDVFRHLECLDNRWLNLNCMMMFDTSCQTVKPLDYLITLDSQRKIFSIPSFPPFFGYNYTLTSKMNNYYLSLIGILLTTSINSFVPNAPVSLSSSFTRTEMANTLKSTDTDTLSNIDFMCEMNVAQFCAENEGECSLDDTNAIVNMFQDQVSVMKARVEKLDEHLTALGGANSIIGDARNVGKIREHIYEVSEHVKTVSFSNMHIAYACEMLNGISANFYFISAKNVWQRINILFHFDCVPIAFMGF